jgi:hypothetical protein
MKLFTSDASIPDSIAELQGMLKNIDISARIYAYLAILRVNAC